MTATWRLVGRREELQHITAAAAAGDRGLVLAGEAGIGKTRLAREAVASLDPLRFRTAQAVATSSSRAIPFGAFAHLLPSETPSQLNRLGWAMQALLENGDGRRLVLSIDDAHLLDEPSAAVVLQLARGDHAFLLVTLRSEEPEPDAVRTLWKDEQLERIELSALSREGVAAMADAMLDGRVDAPTALRLWQVTRGNPLYLREVVLTGREAGTFEEQNGVFRWSGEVAMASRLAELISHRLGELDDDETAALEYVAFGEPIELSTLTDLVQDSAVECVEGRRLLVVDPEGRLSEVRLAHPLYGEGIRAHCPRLRAQHRMRDLAEHLEAVGPSGRDDTLRLAIWRLETGTAHDPELMLAACQTAWAAGDLPLATRLGWAAVNSGGGGDAAVALATILTFRQRFDEATAAVTAGEGLADTDAQRARLAVSRAFITGFGRGRIDATLHDLENVRRAIKDPVARAALAIMRCELLTTSGRGADELRAFDDVIADPRLPPALQVQGQAMTGFAYAITGRRAHALACLDHAMRIIDEWRDDVPYEEPRCCMIKHFTHLVAGELDAAEEAETHLHRQGLQAWDWDFGLGALGLGIAQAKRLRGRVAEAQAGCREAVVALGADNRTFTPCCLAELAHAEALVGDTESSRTNLAQAERLRSPGFGGFNYWIDIARTWVLACDGDVSGGVACAMKTAERANEAGAVAYVVIAAHDAVRLGAPDCAADWLLAATEQAEGPYPATCVDHLAALRANDGDALLAVADRFAELGMMLHGAEAAAQAATALRHDGRATRSRSAAARAWSLAEACQGARTPALTELRAPGLTPSEREVAGLAAAGLSSREIADRLTKSVRTVDNHLTHVYDKLGVHSRRELAGLLDTD